MLHSNFSSHTHVGEIQKHLKSQDAVGEYIKIYEALQYIIYGGSSG